jgi:putative transposase
VNDKTSLPVLDVNLGAKIELGGRLYVITSHIDLDVILCKEVASGAQVVLKLGELNTPRRADPIAQGQGRQRDLLAISTQQWAEAQERREAADAILAKKGKHGSAFYKQLAAENGVSVPTLYRWASTYRSSGYLLSSLVTTKRSGGRGTGRLDERVEAVIADYIRNKWLTTQKRSIKTAVTDIRASCHNAGLPLPAHNTIRLRIDWIEAREKVAKREGIERARDVFDASEGSIPDADWPLQMVQIDHTLLPVVIVDDKYRRPIRRAYITLAIDVFSRVCVGMYITLDPPSNTSLGECLAHAILLKDKWLSRLGLPENVKWPFWGVPEVIHADNAMEFRGDLLQVVADEYHFDIHWRPVKTPNYGAHIERLMGTVTTWLKEVPGATFSGTEEKGVYDADGNACLTFDELERWLVTRFARYHLVDLHAGIGTTPHQKWKEGLLSPKGRPPRGLPPIRQDEDKVRFDFMPIERRTIQNDGVVIDNIKYFDDCLRPWIGLKRSRDSKAGMEHRFRRDPRDISAILFWDPRLNEIFEIRSRLPPVNIWEWRKAQEQAEATGIPKTDELAVFQFVNQNRQIEEESAAKTVAARRSVQRRKEHDKAAKNKVPAANRRPKLEAPELEGYNADSIAPLPED